MKNFWAKYSWKIDTIVLAVIVLGFLAFFFILAANNRPVSEDFEFIRIFRQQGWTGSVFFSFNEHSFRLPSKIIFNLFFGSDVEYFQMNHFIFLYHFLTLSLLIFAVFQLFSSIVKLVLSKKIPGKFLLIFSILWVGSFFFGTFQIAETWFWLISSSIHLLSCVFAILGFAFLLNKKVSFLNYAIIVISFLFAGGSSENLGLFLILLLGLALIYIFLNRKKNQSALFDAFYKKILISFLIVCTSFIINLSGNGTAKRISNQASINIEYAISHNENSDQINEYSFANIHKAIFNVKNAVAVLFTAAFYLLGLWLKNNGFSRFRKKDEFLKKRIIRGSSIILFLVVISTLFPLIYVFKGPGPLRAWVPISLIFTLGSSAFFLLIGISKKSQSITRFVRVLVYSLLPIILIYIIRQYPLVSNYSKSYDDRCKFLTELNYNKNTTTIDLKGLPDSGYLPSGDITHDENNLLNKNFQYILGLNFKVKSTDNYFSKHHH